MDHSLRARCVVVLAILTFPGRASAQTQPELFVQAGHTAAVRAACFSPDGARLATGGFDGDAVLWDVKSGQKLLAIGHSTRVNAVAFSPDGAKLAVSGYSSAAIYDARTGRPVHVLDHRGDSEVFSVSFSPDGSLLATTSLGGKAHVWDIATGARVRTLVYSERAKEPVLAVAFARVGSAVATGGGDGGVIVWDAGSGERKLTLAHGERVNELVYRPDGLALTCVGGRRVTTWELPSGKPLWSVDLGQVDRVHSVDYSSDGSTLVLGTGVRTVSTRDARSGKLLTVLPAAAVPEPFSTFGGVVRYHPNGGHVAVGTGSGVVTLWDVRADRVVHRWEQRAVVGRVRLSPDGRSLATGVGRVAFVVDLDAGRPRPQLHHPDLVGAWRFSPDSKQLLTACADRKIRVWDTDTGTTQATWDHPDTMSETLYSPDGTRVATSGDRGAYIWDVGTGKVLHTLGLAGHAGAFHPDGATLTTARRLSEDDDVPARSRNPLVWDVRAGRLIRTGFTGDRYPPGRRFSPDGSRWVEPNYQYGWVTVFDARTAERETGLRYDPELTTARVEDAFLSPDNTHLVVVLRDGSVDVWDRVTLRKARTIEARLQVRPEGFTPNGRMLWAIRDRVIRFWDFRTGEELVRLLILKPDLHWLACTPAGLFDGSAGGRNLVSYRVNGQVVPVDRFFKDFYRPGLLAAVMKGEKPKPEVDFAAQTPPKVRITSPKLGEVETPVVEIAAEAEDIGGGAQPPWLKHNGVRVASAGQPTKDGKVTRRTFTVTLVEGTNTFEAISACTDGSWESEPARVELKYSRPLDKPRLFVLAVGVSKYADEPLALKFAAKDAVAVHDLFARRGKQLYKSVEPTLLTDGRATRDNIRAAFKDIAARAKPQDVVVVFVAGHGTLVGQRYYFLPAEFKRDPARTLEESVRRAGIPDDELADLMGSVPALKRVLVLDTCNSGGAVGLFAMRGRDVNGLRGVTERMNRSTGVFVLAAAPADASAQEPAELGHGILTYALLAGLRAVDAGPLKDDRGAEPGAGGVVDVLGAFTYATGQVPRLMKKYHGREQDVNMSAAGASFPLLPLRD